MRGSRLARRQSSAAQGIIPAHAGLTCHDNGIHNGARDHPRACGAHSYDYEVIDRHAGSSPRMRGSHAYIDTYVTRTGIIPAHAGLTLWLSRVSCMTRDHPRACGAH